MAGAHAAPYKIFGKMIPAEYLSLGILTTYALGVTYKMKSGPAPIKADPVKKVAGSDEEEQFIRNFLKEAGEEVAAAAH